MIPSDEFKHLTSLSNCIPQFGRLLLLLLKLKAWRIVFIVFPISLLLSNLYVLPWQMSLLSGTGTGEDKRQLVFYGSREFAASQVKVLVDRSDEATALRLIVASGSGLGDWIEDCRKETDCRERLIHQSDVSLVAHLRYSSKSEQSRNVLDCLNEENSHLLCAFLYQVMVQSVHLRALNETFKNVQLFEMHNSGQSEKPEEAGYSEKPKNLSLPESVCADWINNGELHRLTEYGTSFIVVLAAIGVTFYLLISTVSCIHMLKSGGFLQQQFQGGLSVSAYWLAVWLITLIECLVFAGVFMVSHTMQCPGLYSVATIVQMSAFVALFSLNLAAFLLLLEILLPSMLLVSILAIKMNVGLALAFSFSEYLAKKAPYVLYMFPPMFAREYIAGRMNSDVEQLRTGMGIPEDEAGRFSNIIAANLVSLLFLVLLLTYFDFLLKTGNGLCLPPSYPVMSEFWFPRYLADVSKVTHSSNRPEESEPHIEAVLGLPPVVVIEELSKTYSNCCSCCTDAPIVLKTLSCTIYRGQITALIGHNGAGKSTLIKILTGEELPDEGTAHIGGCLVTNPLLRLALRGRISVCPQFDALCDSLTVMECIRVTLVSRAISDNSQLERARGLLQRLGLGDKENVLSCDLSGGQRRKVSTILALLGDPDVVFLDEPTSGLDPVSRRQLWQLLQEEKRARSIILCTQFMDEADILADRKIFLCGGKIVCAGSSMFLKRAFGCRFTLNVSLKSKSGAQSLLAKLNQVQIKSHDETEIQLQVPALNSAILNEAVQVLETSEEVETFGLSQASLGEIFMRLSGMDSDEVIKAFKLGTLSVPDHLENSEISAEETLNKEAAQHSREVRLIMHTSVAKQFGTLLALNLKRQVRVTSSLLSRFLLPAALLTLILVGTLVFKDANLSKLNDSKKAQLGMLTTASSIRSGDFSDTKLAIACIVDDQSDALHKEICETLALYDAADGKVPIILQKSASQSLKEFVSNKSTKENILQQLKVNGWMKNDGSMTPCVLYYASSWQKNVSAKERSVSIGVLIGENHYGATVHIYRRALSKLFQLFGFVDVENTTALSYVRPVGASVRTGISLKAFFYAFCLFPVSYLNDPIEDMSSRVRSYLLSTGMSLSAYWINTFVMHWVQYAFCFLCAVGLLMISEAYRSAYLILAAFGPAYVFGIVSNLLTIYAIAAVTRTKSTIVSVFCNLFVVIVTVAIIQINNPIALQLLVWLLPPAAPLGLIYSCIAYFFYKREYYHSFDGSALPGLVESIYKNPNILYSLVAMPVHIMIMCGIICLAENSANIGLTLADICCSRDQENSTFDSNSDMDEGARKEAERVLVAPLNKRNVLEVRNLRKTYSNGVQAVRGVTFGALADEIFGLLGANGAGKSTSMSVIVGEAAATEGVCKVRLNASEWMLSREAAKMGSIGYCPQHSPLFSSITVAEHVRFFADLRGLEADEAERQTNSLIMSLGLSKHWNKQAGQLSGGNKRRLCLAIALLGDPALIVIDEASTGVDPENKRFIWGAIRRMACKQRSVVITTHSMEEVEALCSRVGIMNKGRMIAVGTVQQLRSLHGDAYTLELLLPPEAESAIRQKKLSIKNAVSEQFKGAQTQEGLGVGLVMQFSVPKPAVQSLSYALKWLEANQSRLGVSYWAFYQMSLDQVFVKLVKTFDEMLQPEEKNAPNNSPS